MSHPNLMSKGPGSKKEEIMLILKILILLSNVLSLPIPTFVRNPDLHVLRKYVVKKVST